jgi:hypothetical protein
MTPSTPVPGQLREWATWYVSSATSYAKCLAS